jgi:hypothetical protein
MRSATDFEDMVEFLGSGDVLQPPRATGVPRLAAATKLTPLTDMVLLALGESLARAAARWPGLLARLHRRLDVQRESLAVQGLITHFP